MNSKFWGRGLIGLCAILFVPAALAGPAGQVTDSTPAYWRESDQRWFYIVDNVSIGMGDGGMVNQYRFGVDPTNLTFPADELVTLSGDWNGDGVTTTGYYHPGSNRFFLAGSNTAGGVAVNTFTFSVGIVGVIPVVGNWDATGGDEVGFYDPATGFWYMASANSTGGGTPTKLRLLIGGIASTALTPVSGNWDGMGGDTIGYYNPATGRWYQINSLTVGAAVDQFLFRVADGGGQIPPGDLLPMVGDWNGNGTDTAGYWDEATVTWFEGNANGVAGAGGSTALTVDLLISGTLLTPATGDWDGPSM